MGAPFLKTLSETLAADSRPLRPHAAFPGVNIVEPEPNGSPARGNHPKSACDGA